jgi:uncharacterized protein DUF6766
MSLSICNDELHTYAISQELSKDKKARIPMGNFILFCHELGNTLDFCMVCICTRTNRSQPRIELSGYFSQTLRDTMENWQSEFLQLMWQVGGLSFLLYVGSPQSKESEQRLEKKLDAILQKIEPEKAQKIIEQLQKEYPEK